jgi:CheY-like chemotaxis protein
MNLCLNARDAMSAQTKGQLVVETRNVDLDQEYCRYHIYARPGQYVLLSVSDTGIGMDAATQEHIFEPFFTTKQVGKGTGLGLATVYGIVKQHGGFIHVYSEPGRGSTFRAYFPIVHAAPEKAPPPESEPVRGGNETILVAEDHEGGRGMVNEILGKLGYTVLLAANGEEAVRIFQQHREEVALLLFDVVMPKLSGPEAFQHIEAIRPGLPVVFATGYSSEAEILNSLAAEHRHLVQKPYSPRALARKVRELLDARSAPR